MMKSEREAQLEKFFLLACVLSFLALVSLGVTGSSLELLTRDRVVHSDGRGVVGFAQGIRSDEWAVITPMALAQGVQTPPFPIVNPALGPDGHNMLVVGMTGVPITHITTLAKPATWGFFFLDTQRALAWYWWLPLFLAAITLWWLGRALWPNQRWPRIALVMLMLTSPYVTAWSYWPAYAVAFPSAAMALAVQVFRRPGCIWSPLLGIPLGLALSGFFLLLYPPWQIPLGYLFSSIAIAIAWRSRHAWRIDMYQGLTCLIALVIVACLIGLWWSDAREAVMGLAETIYPGQRKTLTGGEFNLSVLLRGFANLHSMYAVDFSGTPGNASEFASFYYLLGPIVFLALAHRGRIFSDPMAVCLLGFISFCLAYIFIGVPTAVASWSQWGRVPSIRVDLALGTAQVLLCIHFLWVVTHKQQAHSTERFWGFVAALAWIAVAIAAVAAWPRGVRGDLLDARSMLTWGLAGIAAIALTWGLLRTYVVAATSLGLVTIAAFHPIAIAPTVLRSELDVGTRVAVVGPHFAAMALLASGQSVVNGIHYVPQAGIWQSIDPDRRSQHAWNRYQHLSFELDPALAPQAVRIQSRAADQVSVAVHPGGFDWSKVGAGGVLAPSELDVLLGTNARLSPKAMSVPGWTYWQVKSNQ